MLSYSLGRLIRHVEVLLHDSRSCQQDLALFIVRELLSCIRLNDLVVCIRERDPDASLLVHLRRCQAGCRYTLSSAVSLSDLDSRIVVIEELVELLLEFDRERISA